MAEKAPVIKHIESLTRDVAELQKDITEKDGKIHVISPLSQFNSKTETSLKTKQRFFTIVQQNHADLLDQYYALRSQIMRDCAHAAEHKQRLILNTRAALELAIILENCLSACIGEPEDRNVERLQQDQVIYRKALEKSGYVINIDATKTQNTNGTLGRLICDIHFFLNPIRLLLIRVRNLIIRAGAILNNLANYGPWFRAAAEMIAIVFAYIAWIFFLPRLLVNIIEFGLHIFGLIGDAEISIVERFKVQAYRRGMAISNDLTWFVSGLLICFVYASSAITVGYIILALQACDLLRTIIQSVTEWRRLSNQWHVYELQKANANDDEITEIDDYQQAVYARIQFEYKVLLGNCVNFGLLVLAMGLTVASAAALNPVLPLFGAALAVLITIGTWYYQEQLRYERGQRYNRELPDYSAFMLDDPPAGESSAPEMNSERSESPSTITANMSGEIVRAASDLSEQCTSEPRASASGTFPLLDSHGSDRSDETTMELLCQGLTI